MSFPSLLSDWSILLILLSDWSMRFPPLLAHQVFIAAEELVVFTVAVIDTVIINNNKK